MAKARLSHFSCSHCTSDQREWQDCQNCLEGGIMEGKTYVYAHLPEQVHVKTRESQQLIPPPLSTLLF